MAHCRRQSWIAMGATFWLLLAAAMLTVLRSYPSTVLAPTVNNVSASSGLLSRGRLRAPVMPQTPTLPQAAVDVSMPDTTGYTVIQVNAGGDLQAAINNASCNPNGTIIKIRAGATFNGPWTLPNKNCAPGKWVILRSDAADSSFPAAGTRIAPSYASSMPTIVANQVNMAALKFASPSQNYRLMFLQVKVSTGYGSSSHSLVEIGNGDTRGVQSTVASQPNNIIVDRCLIRGSNSPPVGLRRGIEMQCQNCAVVDSYIDQIHEVGADSQGIAGWNATGPMLIQNNYISAAGMGLLFGGADVTIPNAIISDVTFVRNYLWKNPCWNPADPCYGGTHWQEKNHVELKQGRRILIEGNVLENSWSGAQPGAAFLFKSENQSGGNPWIQTVDIEVRYNKAINISGSAIDFDGVGYPYSAVPATRVEMHDNLFDQITGVGGWYVLLGTQAGDFIFNHNTLIDSGGGPNTPQDSFTFSSIVPVGTPVWAGTFVINNNIFQMGKYGELEDCEQPSGTRVSCGIMTVWRKNLVYNTSTKDSRNGVNDCTFWKWAPNGVGCPAPTVSSVQFVNYQSASGGDYHLQSTSPGYLAATDATDVGADIDLVQLKTAGVKR